MGVRLKSLPAPRRPRQLQQKGTRDGITLTALPLPQASTALHREVSPELTVPPVGKEPGMTSHTPSIVGHFVGSGIHWFYSWRSQKSPGLDHWESNCQKREGLPTTSTQIMADRSPSHRGQALTSFAHAESSRCCSLTREISGMQVCLIWVLK